MEFVDLKNKGADELKQLLAEQVVALRELRFQARSHQLKQVHKVAIVRKTVARLRMLLDAKK
ncbi:MAG: 50S ribosomal protein L29 [bacterium]|nr:50S ribosomal protein L29 [bacterium]